MSEVFDEADAFARAVRRGRPLLGLDLGAKTIGVAVSDLSWCVATPRTTIRRRGLKHDAAQLEGIMADTGSCALVLGLPRNMDGTEGPRCQSTRAFARNLRNRLGISVLLWDERLSTVAAERVLLDADMSRARRKSVIDNVAAAFVLQGALDRIGNQGRAAGDG